MINIIAPDIWLKDAVGNFCLDLAELLGENGLDVKLFAQHFSKKETPQIHDMESFFDDMNDEDTIFLSYSIYDPYLEQILALPNKKVCYFHGVTPPELLEEFEPVTAELCRKSQEQFPLLGEFDVLMANSEFIANDLRKYVGENRSIEVLPPVFPNRFLFNNTCEEKSFDVLNLTLLYVGRVVPHKKVEDIIRVMSDLKAQFPSVKLMIVGDTPNLTYLQFLKDKTKNLNLTESEVVFTGKVDDEQLQEFYCISDVFITMSEHEGFCIPVLEAIYFGLKIIVKKGNAAEEVAGNFSLAINEKNNVSELVKFIKKVNIKSSEKHVLNTLEKNNFTVWKQILTQQKIIHD